MTGDTSLHYGADYRFLPMLSLGSGSAYEVAEDLYVRTIQIVNITYVGRRDAEDWVLIDAGMPGSADAIRESAEQRFGGRPPLAILLTHGHFDHVGGVIELSEHWNVPVYAHAAELPYLTGRQAYPPGDTSVEGGLLADLSFTFPVQPIQLGYRVIALPEDGSVPGLPGWHWVHTPGHTPGHVSFYRPADATLIAGDAFVTCRQDSLYKVFTQHMEVTGPPRYFTPDWKRAGLSVKKLASLRPQVAVTGHGVPVSGRKLEKGLQVLAHDFGAVAVPDFGAYVEPDLDLRP